MYKSVLPRQDWVTRILSAVYDFFLVSIVASIFIILLTVLFPSTSAITQYQLAVICLAGLSLVAMVWLFGFPSVGQWVFKNSALGLEVHPLKRLGNGDYSTARVSIGILLLLSSYGILSLLLKFYA